MKKAYIILPILLIALVGMSCLLVSATPNLDKDDEKSTPNGYAEAIVTGSWSLFGHPYYQTHHQAKTNPSNLAGTAVFTGWNKTGGVVYNVTSTLWATTPMMRLTTTWCGQLKPCALQAEKLR